jgi:hypothetical protein
MTNTEPSGTYCKKKGKDKQREDIEGVMKTKLKETKPPTNCEEKRKINRWLGNELFVLRLLVYKDLALMNLPNEPCRQKQSDNASVYTIRQLDEYI